MKANNMRGAIAWMGLHGVAPNILMAVFIFGGLFMTTKIKQEVFPNFDLDTVTIIVPFPGASPEEVEEGIILAIEEEVRGLDGVDEVYAVASEGSALVTVEILLGSDPQKVNQDIQQAIERIRVFPEDAEEPIISLSTRRRAVIDLEVYGNVDEWSLRQAAEQVRDGLLQHPSISQVDLEGVRDLEIHIEIPQHILREHGLTLSQVGQIVRQSAFDRSGGKVETSGGQILLRVQERRDWARDFENIPIISSADGAIVRLGDMATIREGFEDSNTYATFDGQRAISMTVIRVGDQTPIGVADGVYESMPRILAALPPEINFTVVDDDSEIYRQRLELLLKNGLLGLCLVMLILSMILEFRLAFWVMMGIPTSFLGTLLFLPMLDVSINMVSLFAFILALGIVVDDAIVAGENIYEYRQRGMSHAEAAIRGARDMAIPISYSILTNIVAFMPILFIPGLFGKIWAVIPPVVMIAFLISWVEALFILPAHLAHVKEAGTHGIAGKLHAIQQMVANGFTVIAKRLYGPFLDIAVRWRYATIAVMIAILAFVLAIPASGRMGFILMPQVESEYAQATATLPVGAPREHVDRVVDQLVSTAQEVLEGHGGEKLGKGVSALVKENAIEVRAYLVESSLRDLSTAEVTNLWRERLGGEMAGLETLRFAADAGGPGRGPKVSIELSHRDVKTLERAAEVVAGRLEDFTVVKDIDDGYTPGKTQLDFRATDEAKALGVDPDHLARTVRASFFGVEAIRQQRGRNEITVRVRLPEGERNSEANLESLIVATPDGGEVPLYQVANVSRGRAYTNINRRNGRRIVTVTTNVEPVSETSKVLAAMKDEVMPEIMLDFPGLSFSFEGRQADQRDSMIALRNNYGIALLLIYVLLAIPFRSYVQPLIVMTAIPFAGVGAILGHLIMGFNLSVISVMGMIALSGVVINDALVMVDYANRRRREGATPEEAIESAGIRRFRPIWLTTMTTFCGIAPMIFETSRQARFLIPMALSLGYGIVFATAITLVLVPALYMVVEDATRIWNRIFGIVHPGYDPAAADPDAPHEPTGVRLS